MKTNLKYDSGRPLLRLEKGDFAKITVVDANNKYKIPCGIYPAKIVKV